MIGCPECSHLNNINEPVCRKCRKPLAGIDPRTGLKTFGGTTEGQVLQMRFVIDRELDADSEGVKFLAEDAQQNKNVIIWALPTQDNKAKEPQTRFEELCSVLKTELGSSFISAFSDDDARCFVTEQNLENESIVKQMIADSLGILQDNPIIPDHQNNIQQLEAVVEETEEELTKALNELEEKNKLKEQADRKILDIQQEKQAAEEWNIQYKKQIELLKTDLHNQKQELEKELADARKNLSERTEALKNAEQKTESQTQLLTRIRAEQVKSTEKQNQLASQLEQLKQQHLKAIELRDQAEKECQSFREKIQQLNTEHKHHVEKLTADLQTRENEIFSLQKEKEDAESNIFDYKKTIQSLESNLENLRQNYADSEQAKNELLQKINQTEDQVRQSYENKITELEFQLKEKEINSSAMLDEVERKFKAELNERKKAEHKLEIYNSKIELFEKQLEKEEKKHAEELNSARQKIEQLAAENQDLQRRRENEEKENIEKSNKQSVTIKDLKNKPLKKVKSSKIALTLAPVAVAGLIAGGYYLYSHTENSSPEISNLTHAAPSAINQDADENKALASREQLKVTSEVAGYLDAAFDGDTEAMLLLADAYRKGKGVSKDPEKAVQWLHKAGEKGDRNALFELALMRYVGEEIAKDLETSFEYFTRAAKAGHKLAMFNLGRMYHEGSGTKADPNQAIGWYEKAAQAGITKAMNQLAQIFLFGRITEKDLDKSVHYYTLSANEGNINAMYNLATFYLNGVGVEKDSKTAAQWFERAAQKGDAGSMFKIASMYLMGKGIEQNTEKAIHWYKLAANEGHEASQKQLAKITASANKNM